MKISIIQYDHDIWHDYELLESPKMRYITLEGFGIPVIMDGKEHVIWIRQENSKQRVKFSGKVYDMEKPKDYIALKGIYETEIALAVL
jgi:hypothetical protein